MEIAMISKKRVLIAIVALIVVVLASLTWIVPPLARDKIEQLVFEKTGRVLTIGELKFNPLTLRTTISSLALLEKDSKELFLGFDQFTFRLSLMSLRHMAPVVDNIILSNPYVHLVLNQDGVHNFSDLAASSGKDQTKEQPPAKQVEAKPLLFSLNNIEVTGGRVHLENGLTQKEYQTHTISNLHLQLPFVGNLEEMVDRHIAPSLSFALDQSSGALTAKSRPFTKQQDSLLDISFTLPDLSYYQHYVDLAAPVVVDSGELTIQLKLKLDNDNGAWNLLLSGAADIQNLHLSTTDKTAVAQLQKAHFSLNPSQLNKNSLQIGSNSIEGLTVYLQREPDADWNLQQILPEEQEKSEQAASTSEEKDTTPWSVHFETVDLLNSQILISDKQPERPYKGRIDLQKIHLAQGLEENKDTIDFTVDLTVEPTATFAMNGRYNLAEKTLQADGKLQALSLTDPSVYADQWINARLLSGDVSGTFQLDLQTDGEPAGTINTSISLDTFYMEDQNAHDLGMWDQLNIKKISYQLKPAKLTVELVELDGFYFDIILGKDEKINLQKLLKETPAEQQETAENTASTADNNSENGTELLIKEIRLSEGEISFTDLQVEPAFQSRLHKINMFYLFPEAAEIAEGEDNIKLEAVLDGHAPLLVKGQVKPQDTPLFADLKVQFSDIELSHATPYSGRYLGLEIDRGKTSMDFNWFLKDNNLDTQNHIFIDQLKFGRSVKSDKAVNMPVKLATTLLTDHKGEINLDLPVSGNIDDPQFRVGPVILKVFANLIMKAATSPFALLGSVMGGSTDMSAIAFAPGVATISPQGQKSMIALAGILKQKPALLLEVSPYVDDEQDSLFLRQQILDEKLARLKTKQPAKKTNGQQEGATTEKDKALLKLYHQLPGAAATTDAHMAEEHLLAAIEIDDNSLAALAHDRAQQAITQLTALGVDKKRLFLKRSDIHKAGKEGKPAARVEFGLAAK